MKSTLRNMFSKWFPCVVSFLTVINPITSLNNSTKELTKVCPGLPGFCEYIDYRRRYEMRWNEFYKPDSLVCENGLDEKMLADLMRFREMCRNSSQQSAPPQIYVNMLLSVSVECPRGWQIANDSFGIFKLNHGFETNLYLRFFNLKGFDIMETIYIYNIYYISLLKKNLYYEKFRIFCKMNYLKDILSLSDLSNSLMKFCFYIK